MGFFTDMGGILLLLACVGIVIIFLLDFLKMGKTGLSDISDLAKTETAAGGKKTIVYEIYYKNRTVASGEIARSELPVQFGREKGYGNDIIVVPHHVPEEDAEYVSRAWFFIRSNTAGQTVVYSADPSKGTEKQTAASKGKLRIVENGSEYIRMSVRLESELVLRAGKFHVILKENR